MCTTQINPFAFLGSLFSAPASAQVVYECDTGPEGDDNDPDCISVHTAFGNQQFAYDLEEGDINIDPATLTPERCAALEEVSVDFFPTQRADIIWCRCYLCHCARGAGSRNFSGLRQGWYPCEWKIV